MHEFREEVNADHAASSGSNADGPRQSMNHQPPQSLTRAGLLLLLNHLSQYLLRDDSAAFHGQRKKDLGIICRLNEACRDL